METIDKLADRWVKAKQLEESARDQRIEIEEQILALRPAREEGSESFTTPLGFKVKTTGKLTYKATNLDMLKVLTSDWPDEAKPFKVEVKVDESKLRAIRQNAPLVWAKLAPAVEVKPAKTAVSIEHQEN